MALFAALITGRCSYSLEDGGYDLSRFREDETLVSVPEELRGIVPTNHEAARAVAARDDGRDLRFVVIGDTISDGNKTFRAFLGEIAALDPPPAFIVHLGDRVVKPVVKYYGTYLKLVEDAPYPILHVDGNHDVREQGERISRAFFGERDFSFDLGDKRFVFMGNSRPAGAHGFSREQLDWLDRTLGAPGTSRTFFFTHVPPRAPFKRIDPGLASLLTPAIESEREFLDILARHHVVLAAFGHRHVHASLVYNGTLMVITGGGGQRNVLDPNVREPRFTKERHYTLVDIPSADAAQPFEGILTCMGRAHESLFVSSFSQPSLLVNGGDLAVRLGPYPASEAGPYRPGDPAAIWPGASSRWP
jgi:predicted phosphodiesterase